MANNEPFQVDFMVRNKRQRTIVARLNHLIEPRRLANRLEMIACGSLLPLRLRPREIREISSSYIFGGELAPKARISITYEFVLDSRAAKTNATFQLRKAKVG